MFLGCLSDGDDHDDTCGFCFLFLLRDAEMVRSFLLQYLNFFRHSTYWKLSLISCPVVLLSWHKLNSEALHPKGRKYYHLSDMPSQWPGCWMVMLVLVVMALSFISIHGQPDNHGKKYKRPEKDRAMTWTTITTCRESQSIIRNKALPPNPPAGGGGSSWLHRIPHLRR